MKRPAKLTKRQLRQQQHLLQMQQGTENGRVFNDKFADERQAKVCKVIPKNDSQRKALHNLDHSEIVLLVGSAGTGKTFLSATWAANYYLKNPKAKIYLARPYVTMGRTAGLLPGTAEEKMAPFLAPLTSVLKNQLGHKYEADFGKNIQIQLVEAIRGLDLKDAVLLVDEAQNLTRDEIKSIVTRLGEGGKIIFTGDTMQSDLPEGESGLDWLMDITEKYDIEGVSWTEFSHADCVRSGIVKQFLYAFDKEGI